MLSSAATGTPATGHVPRKTGPFRSSPSIAALETLAAVLDTLATFTVAGELRLLIRQTSGLPTLHANAVGRVPRSVCQPQELRAPMILKHELLELVPLKSGFMEVVVSRIVGEDQSGEVIRFQGFSDHPEVPKQFAPFDQHGSECLPSGFGPEIAAVFALKGRPRLGKIS